jgi:mono/diheme cytochrome c family protein
MRRAGSLWLLIACGAAMPSRAETALDPTALHGRQLYVQACGICHLKPNLLAERYGPALSRATVDDKEEGVRALVRGGSQRMPGFQHDLTAAEIDAIIAYLKTVPAPAPPQPGRAGGPSQAD